MELNLEAARITALPGEAFYISDFITEDEEDWLLRKVGINDFLMN
jgi:alkylated DNA repair protein alkB family protein 6